MSRVRTAGFTLIEVLVALVIVAAGCGALLAALNSAANSTSYLTDKTFAQWAAANRIAEARLATNPPGTGKIDGAVEYAGRRWSWRQEVAATQLPGVRRIDVSMRPKVEGAAAAASDSWTVTISGVIGSAVAAPNGTDPDWEPPPANPSGQNPPGSARGPNAPPAPAPNAGAT